MKKTVRLLLLTGLITLGSAGAIASIYETEHQTPTTINAVSEGFHLATLDAPYVRSAYSGNYYSSVDLSATGDALLEDLRSLSISEYTGSSYDGLKTGLPAICKPADGGSYMVGFYNRAHLTNKWDGASTWNREHTWPNSRGAGKSGAGSHPFCIMPTSVSINSSRGNSFYGLGSSNTWDPGQYDTQFRGAAARCILYAAMHYSNLTLSENPGDDESKNTMGVKSLLLEWNRTYAPDDDESYRNELTAERYGVRNPFIDYPYLADNIWGDGSGISSSDSQDSNDSSASSLATPDYVLASSALKTGDKIIINSVSNGSGYALSKYNINDSRPWYKSAEASSVSDGGLSSTASMAVFTVTEVDGGYTLEEEDKGHLVAYTSGSHTSISYESDTFSSDATSTTWNVSIASDGTASLYSTIGTTNIYLSYVLYNSTPEYQGSATASSLYIFKLNENDGGNSSDSSSSSETISSEDTSSDSESSSSSDSSVIASSSISSGDTTSSESDSSDSDSSSTVSDDSTSSEINSSEDSSSNATSESDESTETSESSNGNSSSESISSSSEASDTSSSGSSTGGSGCSSSIGGGIIAASLAGMGIIVILVIKRSKKKEE